MCEKKFKICFLPEGRMSSLLDKVIAKASFDPALEKQIADNKQQAREARATLQKAVSDATVAERKAVQDRKLTSVGATYLEAFFTDTTKWVDTNPNASANEVSDKNTEFTTKLAQLYTDDASRLYYSNSIMYWSLIFLKWKRDNKISEDVYKKGNTLVDKEQAWYTKHPDETIQVYQDRLTTLYDALIVIINDPQLKKELDAAFEKLKAADSSNNVEALKANAEQAKRDQDTLAQQNFSASRVMSKAAKGVMIAFGIALFLAFGFIGAALASNFAITRSIPMRILCWLYGFMFSLPVIFFFLYRYYKGTPPMFYAYLIPLYIYTGDPLQKRSFFDRLVTYVPSAL